MDKESGVYITLTDNSIQTNGTQELKVLVPMFTKKGELGLNLVTAENFKDILGYEENSAYFGLSRLLETISYVKVLRLNQEGKIAYNGMTGSTESYDSAKSYENVDSLLKGFTTVPTVLVGNKEVGDWGTIKVKFTPNSETQSESISGTGSKEITVNAKVSKSVTETMGDYTIVSGLKIYDSSDSELAYVVTDENGTYNIRKVLDGSDIIDIVGTVTFGDTTTLTISDVAKISQKTINVHYAPVNAQNWTMYTSVDGTINETYEFSFDKDSENYIGDKVDGNFRKDFGDATVFFNLPETSDVVDTTSLGTSSAIEWFELKGGDDGKSSDDKISINDIDTSVFDTCGCNILLMNGLTSYKLVNRLATKCIKNKIHMFVDAPADADFASVKEWASHIVKSEYVAIGARPDQTENSEGKVVYIYPSVNYGLIYANMLANHQYLNFPPAGATYGVISADNLLDCNYEQFGNELKTNRINWQRSTNLATMMWEQRTTYALDSDLSYIAPTFIVDALADEIVTFEQNFNFRYMTPTDILNQQTGLTKILENYVSNYFLYSYNIKMPTYAEAQKAGRTLTIPIEIVIMKDSEVININLILNNA